MRMFITASALLVVCCAQGQIPGGSSTPSPDKPSVTQPAGVAASPAPEAASSPSPAPTPYPARGAALAAMQLYPALAQKDSAFNLLFLDLLEKRKKTNPASLQEPDWPLQLARETAEKLGVQPLTTPTPAPPQMAAQSPSPAPNPFLQDYSNPLDKGGYDEKKSPLPIYRRHYYYWPY